LFKIKISAATSGTASEFNLAVLDPTDLAVETFPNLTMDSTKPRYVETVINGDNGSTRIKATDLGVVGSATPKRPANVT